ncbi:MAG: hypothetical protein COU47_04420 [Candidatus Niyogibacteria bacterium CG10_big_fil_rev_8_21_14_0_10_46_36]|uniref:Uncharacterized protein n=1 Tax=Candidatus Niyogibacteria bacterium CG10_big_fil_rev_8_21_14_0_10_46_36 TaxID=1974726 RepID=A0A2H0TCL8_9BACT|nr:MAG: hypothetical protein COU47_04420 [Candidatus Niyogibacteria bacterium CG10_big_fil_rev_8_21_14_0_10_46_36]
MAKKLGVKRIVKKITLWECPICKTRYKTETKAKCCAQKPVEKQSFAVGDTVRCKETRECSYTSKKGKHRMYTYTGQVVKIHGPEPADEEYEKKWLGWNSKRLNSHVFSYIIEFQCPVCGKKKSDIRYAPELEKA